MNIVTFSGAGLSKESGIPTFRDSKDGLWHNHKVEEVASPQGWSKDKAKVLNFYADRMANIKAAEPNDAHKAFAKLDEQYDVLHITQNIDDLLERAGCKNVRHLHGSIFSRKCEKHNSCGLFQNVQNDPTCPCDYQTLQTEAVKLGDLCPKCNSQLRPDVVFFNEMVNMLDIYNMPPMTDIFIVVGTSAVVHPAASLVMLFRHCPELYYIDPTPAPRLQSYIRYEGPATKYVPELVNTLLNVPTEERLAKRKAYINSIPKRNYYED